MSAIVSRPQIPTTFALSEGVAAVGPKGLSVDPAVSAVAQKALSLLRVCFKVQIKADQWMPSEGWAVIEVLDADANQSVKRIPMTNFEDAYWSVQTKLREDAKFIVSFAYQNDDGSVVLMRELGGYRTVTGAGYYFLKTPAFY